MKRKILFGIVFLISMVNFLAYGFYSTDSILIYNILSETEHTVEVSGPNMCLSVERAIAKQNGREETVVGYIVGWFNNKPNPGECVFTNQATVDTTLNKANVLIADSPYEINPNKVLCVQLPAGNVRDLVNLGNNPDNIGKALVVKGILTNYNGLPGVKTTSYAEINGKKSTDPQTDLLCYRTKDGVISGSSLKVGDVVVIKTVLINFKGIKLEANSGYFTAINGTVPVGALSVSDALTQAAALQQTTGSGTDYHPSDSVFVTGTVSQIIEVYSSQYKNISYYLAGEVPMTNQDTTVRDKELPDTIVIPNKVLDNGQEYTVVHIADDAFSYSTNLKSIFIPNTITSIGIRAFEGCENLAQIELPDVKTIDPYAFANCIGLSKVLFGQNLETVGENAFANCIKLVHITSYATIVPLASNNSFANYNGYLSVPCEVFEDYSVDFVFGTFKNIQCLSADPATATTELTVVAGVSDALFTWPVSSSAQSYTLVISKDDVVFCTLRFNANGQLLGITFVPSVINESNNVGAKLTSAGYQFSVTGLNSASLYTYELKALDASNNELASYAGQFSTDGYVGIGNVELIEGVYAQNGNIVIENDTNLPVAIYDVVGRLVASGSSLTQQFAVPNAGLYLVKVGNQTMKVLVP